MQMQKTMGSSREIMMNILALIDEMHALRNNIAMVLGVKPTSVNLGIAKDGIAFDLTVNLTVTDDSINIAKVLEIVGIDGLAFRNIQTKPALGNMPRRITARVLSPDQIIAVAA